MKSLALILAATASVALAGPPAASPYGLPLVKLLDKDGTPKLQISCGKGKRHVGGPCYHIRNHFETDDIWTLDDKFYMAHGIDAVLDSLEFPENPFAVLDDKRFAFAKWTRDITFGYGKGHSFCNHGCTGHFPLFASLMLTLRTPKATSGDFVKTKNPFKPDSPFSWDTKFGSEPTAQTTCVCPLVADKKLGQLDIGDHRLRIKPMADLTPTNGLIVTPVARGENYGPVFDLILRNPTSKPITWQLQLATIVKSLDDDVQSLLLLPVPYETVEFHKSFKPLTVPAGEFRVLEGVPGVCLDFELPPPTRGLAGHILIKPDDTSKPVAKAVADAIEIDLSKLGLEIIDPNQVTGMVVQGAVWKTESHTDPIEGNEVTDEMLEDKFWKIFVEQATDELAKLKPKQREQVTTLVKEDIKKIVGKISFVSKRHIKKDE